MAARPMMVPTASPPRKARQDMARPEIQVCSCCVRLPRPPPLLLCHRGRWFGVRRPRRVWSPGLAARVAGGPLSSVICLLPLLHERKARLFDERVSAHARTLLEDKYNFLLKVKHRCSCPCVLIDPHLRLRFRRTPAHCTVSALK